MQQKVTINMVAERAGVSRGTVDRVLNQRPHVKPELYDRIVLAMRELGYTPPREEQAQALGLPVRSLESCRLGVLLPNNSSDGYYLSEMMRGIADAKTLLRDYSVEVLVEECETNLPEECIERMDHLLEQGVNGLAISAMDHTMIAEKVDRLYEQGLPVVIVNSDLSHCRRLCFVGQNVLAGGRVAGELMSKCIRPEDSLLIAIGNPEFNAHRLRLQGFCERIYERGFSGGSLEIIETYNDYALTNQKVREVLERVPNVKGIYMANQSITGCVEAIRGAGKSGEICVISHDLSEATKRLLQRGEVDFAIAQNIYQQGYRPLMVLRDYLQKHILPDERASRSTIEIVCSENLG